jgi:hypothetical protein
MAVYSLWHFPSYGLESAIPDVIRHTALRSSDFPLSASRSPEYLAFAKGQRPSDPASAKHYYKMILRDISVLKTFLRSSHVKRFRPLFHNLLNKRNTRILHVL